MNSKSPLLMSLNLFEICLWNIHFQIKCLLFIIYCVHTVRPGMLSILNLNAVYVLIHAQQEFFIFFVLEIWNSTSMQLKDTGLNLVIVILIISLVWVRHEKTFFSHFVKYEVTEFNSTCGHTHIYINMRIHTYTHLYIPMISRWKKDLD